MTLEQLLTNIAALHRQKLHWKESVVDLMKLIGLDSSFDNRLRLAQQAGIAAGADDDNFTMNTELHAWLMLKLSNLA